MLGPTSFDGGWSHCAVVGSGAKQIRIEISVIGVAVGAGDALPEPLLPQLSTDMHMNAR